MNIHVLQDNSMCKCIKLFLVLAGCALIVGCGPKVPQETGFLSTYDNLRTVDNTRMRYVSEDLKNYSSYIVDPIELRVQEDPPVLTAKDRAEVAVYFRQAFVKVLTERGIPVVEEPGVDVARVRLALTDVQSTTWWLNLHPASKLSGAGTGGATMEGEIIDSVTGNQLAAVVQAGKATQFKLDSFSTLNDVKETIDEWAKTAGERLDDLRGKNRTH
jgi:hypothetical protein